MPSLQEAYSLPNSPKHIATITNGLQNVRLAQPPSPTAVAPAWPQFLPQHSRLTQRSTQQQAVAASSARQSAQGQNVAQHGGRSQDFSQNSDWGGGGALQMGSEPAVVNSLLQYPAQQSESGAANAAGVLQNDLHVSTSHHLRDHRQHHSAVAASMQGQSRGANSIAQSLKQSRNPAAAHAALQGSDALAASADRQHPEWSNVTSSKGLHGMWGSQERVQPDVQHFEEEALAQQAGVQELACRKHLAGYVWGLLNACFIVRLLMLTCITACLVLHVTNYKAPVRHRLYGHVHNSLSLRSELWHCVLTAGTAGMTIGTYNAVVLPQVSRVQPVHVFCIMACPNQVISTPHQLP